MLLDTALYAHVEQYIAACVLNMEMEMSFFGKKRELTAEQSKAVVELIALIEKEYEDDELKISLDHSKIYSIMEKHQEDEDASGAIDEILREEPNYEGPEEDDDAEVSAIDISAQSLDKDAMRLAAKLDSIPGLSDHLLDVVETDTKRRRLPAVIAFDISRNMEEAEVDAEPEPGTKYNDPGYGDGPNEKRYDVRKAGEGSYYGDVAKGMKEGQRLLQEWNDVRAALDEKQQTPPKYNQKSVAWLEAEEETAGQRFRAFAGSVKTAFTLVKNLIKVKRNTLLTAVFATEKHGEETHVRRGNVPMRIFFMHKDEQIGKEIPVDRYVSVSTFNKKGLIDKVAMLKTAPEQLAAFKIVKGKQPSNAEKGKEVVINNVGDFASALYLQSLLVTDKDFKGNVYKMIASDEGGEFLDTLDVMVSFGREILNKPEMREKLADYREVKAAAKIKEDNAKKNKEKAAA